MEFTTFRFEGNKIFASFQIPSEKVPTALCLSIADFIIPTLDLIKFLSAVFIVFHYYLLSLL